MPVRFDVPPPGSKWPAYIRTFNVNKDGTESEITEVRAIHITIRPDDVISALIETYASGAPAVTVGAGSIAMLCPHCGKEVACSEIS